MIKVSEVRRASVDGPSFADYAQPLVLPQLTHL